MSLNETMARLAEDVPVTSPEPGQKLTEIPMLDEWELTLTVAALRQYAKLSLCRLESDTPRQKKRKDFNRRMVSSAIYKLRTAHKNK